MTPQPGLIFVTSEDDRYLVKGGIGTATGVLTDSIRDLYPDRRVDWITESPTAATFVEREGSLTRHYLSRTECGVRMPLSRFARVVDDYLRRMLDQRLEDPNSPGLIIEAADWEGLASAVFRDLDGDEILKVSRLHTPLALCAQVNELALTAEDNAQMEREGVQLSHSDLLSAPTGFVLSRTLETVLAGSTDAPPTAVIPNCADVAGFLPSENGQRQALDHLLQATGIAVPEAAFKIFVLGSVEYRKGVRIIQDAIPKVFDSIPNCHLVWIGHFASSDELTANSKLPPEAFYSGIPERWRSQVHLTGFIDHGDLHQVLPGADLFAVCYLADNFPGVVLEIALSEQPVVALLRGGVREMIMGRDRPMALVLDDALPDSISEQLRAAANQHFRDPTEGKTLARKLRLHVLDRFSPDTVTPSLLATYDHHLDRKRGTARPWARLRPSA
ncbi:MAG: glycosyltransferase family 4 protein [Gemmatimonadetes bacterium]|nr:glycosyltransferase family 4 protein [Gemmatimonadota bacterium]